MIRLSKPKIIASLLVPAFGLSMLGNVIAADQDKQYKSTTSKSSSSQTQGQDRNMRASRLIGTEVRNPQGENLGEINDLVLDVTNDRVHFAILSFGGVLGVGDKLFAYPIRSFSQSRDGDKLVLNVEKDRLKSAPGFERDKAPDWSRYGEEVERYHGGTAAVKPMPNAVLRRASDLIGKDIDDRSGKDMGEVEDIIVNLKTGAVPYAVMEFDRSWNLDDKLLAVPLRTIGAPTAERGDLVMNIDKSKLDTAKAFDKRRWPDINDPKHIAQVRQDMRMMAPERSAGRTGGLETPQGYTGPGSVEEPAGSSTTTPESSPSGQSSDEPSLRDSDTGGAARRNMQRD